MEVEGVEVASMFQQWNELPAALQHAVGAATLTCQCEGTDRPVHGQQCTRLATLARAACCTLCGGIDAAATAVSIPLPPAHDAPGVGAGAGGAGPAANDTYLATAAAATFDTASLKLGRFPSLASLSMVLPEDSSTIGLDLAALPPTLRQLSVTRSQQQSAPEPDTLLHGVLVWPAATMPQLSSLELQCLNVQALPLHLFPSLKSLSLQGLRDLQHLDLVPCSSSLEELKITFCDSQGAMISLNLSPCTALASVNISNTALAHVQLPTTDGCPRTRLTTLKLCNSQNLTELDLTTCVALQELNVDGCDQLEALDLAPCATTLQRLRAECTELSTIEGLSDCLQLAGCSVSYSSATAITCPASLRWLDANYCGSLQMVDVRACREVLQGMSATGCTSLAELDMSGCASMHTLRLDGCTSLWDLNVEGCETLRCLLLKGCTSLCFLDVTGCSALEELEVESSGLHEVNVSRCGALRNVKLGVTKLVGLPPNSAVGYRGPVGGVAVPTVLVPSTAQDEDGLEGWDLGE